MSSCKFSESKRKYVNSIFGGRCGYCGNIPDVLQIDHINPRCRGGKNDLENLMPACGACNNFKFNWSLEEFRHEISQQVIRARKRSVNFRTLERFGMISVIKKPVVFYFETKIEGIENES